jgi:hypothetical protein
MISKRNKMNTTIWVITKKETVKIGNVDEDGVAVFTVFLFSRKLCSFNY